MKSLNEKLRKLPAKRQQKIQARTFEIIQEELTLKQLRTALEITQEELAERLETGQDSVSKIESRKDVKVSTLRQFAEALECELVLSVRLPENKADRMGERRLVELTGFS